MNSYSLVIPTYNAARFMPALLDKIKDLSLSDRCVDVVFIDSMSTDSTRDLIQSHGYVCYPIDKNNFDHGGTRSLAASLTAGEIVVFLTQDACPVSQADIEALVDVFTNSCVGAAYGRQLPYPDASPFAKHLRHFNYPDNPYVVSYADKARYGIKTAFLSNSFAAYRRKAMDEIGWFKPKLILGEDMYAGAVLLNKGYSIAYQPKARVYHSHNYTCSQEFRRYFDIGAFHTLENWMLEQFGQPESEGMKYVLTEIQSLLSQRKPHYIALSLWRNFLKYIAYKLGRSHRLFPLVIKKRLSMHPSWWS